MLYNEKSQNGDEQKRNASARQQLLNLSPIRPLPTDEFLGAVQLLGAQFDVVLQIPLLLRHGREFVIERLKFVRHLATQRRQLSDQMDVLEELELVGYWQHGQKRLVTRSDEPTELNCLSIWPNSP